MLANGVDIVTVSDILGHADIDSTSIYLHPYEKTMRNATNTLEKIIITKESETIN
jgi:site-specific recombinase XerD